MTLRGRAWPGALACVVVALVSPIGSARGDVLRVGRDGATVQQVVDASREGDVVEVPPGTWRGSVRIAKRITLRGAGGVIDGGGVGSTIIVAAPGAVVEKISVRRSGSDLAKSDACIYVEQSATGAIIRDNQVEDCAFGIWLHRTRKAQIIGNRIKGRKQLRPTDRGNGIQLFDGRYLVVRGNVVSGSRDGIYVSGTDDSLIENNRTDGQRYGVHYMFSQRNILRNNHSSHNLSGFALMESKFLVVEDNVAADNKRHGILFRDAEDCKIRRNRLERNGMGMIFFSSADNVIEQNWLVHNDVGAKIWAGSQRNRVSGNLFIGNRQQVFYVGAKDLVWGVDAPGNYWSDYVGWDQDGDGLGDRPYRMASFTSTLVYKYPQAALLLHSPALELLSHLEERMPLLTVPTIVDMAPQMRARPRE